MPENHTFVVCNREASCQHKSTWRCDFCTCNLNRRLVAFYYEPRGKQ